MSSQSATKRRGRRAPHALGGCATCRRRHVKCDQVKPSCLACRAVGANCEGYPADLRWIHHESSHGKKGPNVKKDGNQATRHILFTEQSRGAMSAELAAKLGHEDIDTSLSQIDAKIKEPNSSRKDDLIIGPFGVFDFNASPETGTGSMPDNNTPPDIAMGIDILQTTPSGIGSFSAEQSMQLQWADLFQLDFENMLLTQQLANGSMPQDLSYAAQNFGVQEPWVLGNMLYGGIQQGMDMQDQQNMMSSEDQIVPPMSDLSVLSPETNLLADSQFLLKHFQDTVIPQFVSIPTVSKSPWKFLHLATAVQTLAELTYLERKEVNNAKIANLYAILVISAYHLTVNPKYHTQRTIEYWQNFIKENSSKAKMCLQESLRTELNGPKKAKYKEQLMAVLSMLSFTKIMCGRQKDARAYMVDAERLLRLRGLAKRVISRKARFLHHVYTWMRIVGESTYVTHDYEGLAPILAEFHVRRRPRSPHNRGTEPTRGIQPAQPRSGHNARLDDFLRLTTHDSDSDLELNEPKDKEIGLHDIHLEDSREYTDTLYLEIYGIPETWLSLVSQTTRLANIMDIARYSTQKKDSGLRDMLERRAGRLESMICTFASQTPRVNSSLWTPRPGQEGNVNLSSTGQTPNFHMLQALTSALVILFYRRIRNVNSLILQGHVQDVIKALKDFDASLIQHGLEGPGTPWPAFIAGSEAQSQSTREFFSVWISNASSKCNLSYFAAAKELMFEVWKRRDKPQSTSTRIEGDGNNSSSQSRSSSKQTFLQSNNQPSWIDISREQNKWLVLG